MLDSCHSPFTSMPIPATKQTNDRLNSRSTKRYTRSMLCLISGTNHQRLTSKYKAREVRHTCSATMKRQMSGRCKAALMAMIDGEHDYRTGNSRFGNRKKAEQRIESCERCHPDDAEIPFDWILADVTGSRGPYEFMLSEPARCPNRKHGTRFPSEFQMPLTPAYSSPRS